MEARALLSAGSLDASFGNGGIVTTNFIEVTNLPGWSDSASSVALQADGRIVVAGTTQPNGGPLGAISRYNADGSLDTTFSGDGKVSDARFNSIQDVAVQADGRIVVVGRAYPVNGNLGNFAVGRFDADGSPDTTFGTNGLVITNPGAYDTPYAVAVLGDGRILVTGQSGQPGPEQPNGFTTQKFNSDGTIDTSFGNNGLVRTFYTTAEVPSNYGGVGNVAARDVVVQSDGKIVVAGNSLELNNKFAVVRYHSDGSLDTSFDIDGRVSTSLGNGRSYATSMALQGDGKLIVGGYFLSNTGGGHDFALARYNTDGSLDTSFSGDGKIVLDFGGSNDFVYDVKVQSDGAIVVTGAVGNALAVARFNPDGSPDASFGTAGLVTTTVQATSSGSEVVIQPNGGIVVAGTVNNGNGNQFLNRDFVVARYNGISNSAPIANGDDVATDEANTVTFSVLGNDTDAENNIIASLTSAISSPAAGMLTNNGNGSFTFNPNGAFESLAAGESTQVSFDYQIEDAYGEISTATVSITIDGVNDAASISGDDSGALTEDEAGDSGVLTVSDVDNGQNAFQPQVDTVGTYGTFSIDAAGNWSYTRTADLQSLAAGASVTDSFTVTSLDGTGIESVAITITGENDAPTITVAGPANLITNGSFEAPATGNVPGWVSGPGSFTGTVASNFVGGLGGVTGVDGSQLLFMFGHNAGWSLEQAISSTAGVEHTLSFAYGKAGDWFRQATTRAQIFLASNLSTPIADTGALNPGLSPNGTDRTNLFQAGLTFTPAEGNLVIRFTETSANRVFTTLDNVVLTTASASVPTYVENSPALVITSGLQLSDIDDSNLESATVAITGGFQANADVLGFSDQNGITGSYNAATGVLTLTGTATIAQYQAAIASVTYFNSSDNPNETDRTVSFTVSDGDLDSATVISTLTVLSVNDAPAVTVAGPTNLLVNGNFEAASSRSGDVPGWENGPGSTTSGSGFGNAVGGIGTWPGADGAQGLLMLGHDAGWSLGQSVSSTAGVEHTLTFAYGKAGDWWRQATTRAQVFLASDLSTPIADTGALNPGTSPSGTDRTELFQASLTFTPADGDLVVRFIETAANRVFTTLDNVVLTAEAVTAYVENDAPTVVDATLTLADVDDVNLESATVAITAGFQSAEDSLGFTDQNGITGSYSAATGVLTLTGTATVADYQTALASVTYFNSSENPDETNRTVSFTVNDGDLNSAVVVSTVTVEAVDTTEAVLDFAGNLVVTDVFGGDTNDNLTLVVDGSDFHIFDAGNYFDVRIPVASVTGDIIINTLAGDDTLNIDLSGGAILPAIFFNGGEDGFDSLELNGGVFDEVTYNFDNESDGFIEFEGQGVFADQDQISYLGLEPITSTVSAANVVLNYSDASETITVSNAGSGQLSVDSTSGEILTFIQPTNSISIDAGGGDDDIVLSVTGAITELTIIGGDGVDSVDFASSAGTNVAGALNVSAESITDSGTLTVAGLTNLVGNTIVLDSAGNDFVGAFSASGSDVTVTDANAMQLGTVTATGNLVVGTAGNVDAIGPVNVGETLVIDTNANGGNGGAITGEGVITVAGDTTLDAGDQDVVLANPSNNFGGVINVTANNVTIEDVDGFDLGTLNVTGVLYIDPENFEAGVHLIGNTLYIIGTDGRDKVDLKFNEKKDELKVNVQLDQGGQRGGSDGGSDGDRDAIKATFDISAIDRIVAYLCEGDDQYNGGSDGGSDGGRDGGSGQAAISQFVFGGAGNDNIQGGRGNDVLSGGSGKDDIKGGSGADIIIGGTGKDNLKGGRGNDLIIGGSTANEDDLFALDQALAAWSTDDLSTALNYISNVTDDNEKDDLFGEQGDDYLYYGNGDKRKN